MNLIWVLVIIFIFGALIFLNTSNPNHKDVRDKYLDDLARFLDGTKEALEQPENSFRVNFKYNDREYCFEDIEDYGFQSNSYKGFLKRKTRSEITMSFTEKTKNKVRSSSQKVGDGWLDRSGDVRMKKPLDRFHMYTNNSEVAGKLINDNEVFNIFKSFMNVDGRGHPIMSLEIIEGVITLRFHGQSFLKPSLGDLKGNVTKIQGYFAKLALIEDKLCQLL